MFTYKKVTRYSQFTGKPAGFIKTKAGIMDDFSGELVGLGGEEESFGNLYTVKIDYNTDSEPCWGEDPLPDFLAEAFKQRADSFEFRAWFWDEPYHFLYNQEAGCDSSLGLAKLWMKGLNKKGNLFFGCPSFEEAARRSRTQAFSQLLKEKKIDLNDFLDLHSEMGQIL